MIKKVLVALVLLLAMTGIAEAKNPGVSADKCVNASGTTITNNCSEQVFILWCGDLQYSNQRCGNGPKGGYYTHSDNLRPGQSKDLAVKPNGHFMYAACFGGISFGNSGEYRDYPNGNYDCLPR